MNNKIAGLGVSILWDFQNVRATQTEIQYVNAFAYLNGNLTLKKVYSDWQLEKDRKLYEKFFCEGFEIVSVPSYKDKPNRTDHKLIFDCRRGILNNPDIKTVILVSGDADFKTLVQELKSQNKKVIGIARCQNNTSQKLRQSADEFFFFNQIDRWFGSLKLAA